MTKDLELFHVGVKGMKWGVRKKSAPEPTTARKYSELSKKEKRTVDRITKRSSYSDLGKASDYMNEVGLDKLNKKYANKELLGKNGEYNATGKKYLAEHDTMFETKYREIASSTVREKTKGRINFNGD